MMFLVYDTVAGAPMEDGYGHVKVYANEKAAKRRAGAENNATMPRLDRYGIAPVSLSFQYDQGRPIVRRIGDRS